MKRSAISTLWISLAACALSTTSAVAGTFSPNDVPARAQVVGHVDLDAFRGSKLAAAFATEIAQARAQLTAELKSKGIGLSADDLWKAESITFWAEGDEGEKGALILTGVDTAKLAREIKKLPEHRIAGKLHQVEDTYIGFSGSRTVIADDRSSVDATLNVLTGGGKSLAQVAKSKQISGTRGVLFVAAFEEAIAKKIKKEAGSAFFKNITLRRGTVTVAEKAGSLIARAALETTDSAGADQLHKLAAGAISFASVASDSPELGRLMGGIDIKTVGTSVTFTFELPVSELKDITKKLDK